MPLVIGTRAKATVLCAGVTDLYAKLRNEANRQGFNVKDMPPDGDCALHAVIDQLHLERHRSTDEHTQTQHTVTTLGSSAVQLLMNHPVDSNFLNSSQFDSFHDYLKKQTIRGTWCDELILRHVSDVVDRKIVIVTENGY